MASEIGVITDASIFGVKENTFENVVLILVAILFTVQSTSHELGVLLW